MTSHEVILLANSIRKHGGNKAVLIEDICARLLEPYQGETFRILAKGEGKELTRERESRGSNLD